MMILFIKRREKSIQINLALCEKQQLPPIFLVNYIFTSFLVD